MFCSINLSVTVPSAESDVYSSEEFAWPFFTRQNITMSSKRKQNRNTAYKLDSKMGTRLEVSTEKSGILQFYFCNTQFIKRPQIPFTSKFSECVSIPLVRFSFNLWLWNWWSHLQTWPTAVLWHELVLVLWIQFIQVQRNQQRDLCAANTLKIGLTVSVHTLALRPLKGVNLSWKLDFIFKLQCDFHAWALPTKDFSYSPRTKVLIQ